MIVAGVMSGTSADGINIALVDIGDERRKLKIIGHAEFPYPRAVHDAVLAAMNASRANVADLARLNFLLAELYSEAIQTAQRKFRVKAQLVGCHGQTLYHQGEGARFLGEQIACTWQIGDGSVIASRIGVPVVSDFRPSDMASGGKGAPLVPFLDYWLFRDRNIGRIVQNIGGIANLTAIPAQASADEVIAFDTGPGNMVIDALTEQLFHKPYDRNGRIAASGRVSENVVSEFLREKYFRRRPPKTAGREEFGRDFVKIFLARCRRARSADIIATATALTVRSIADAARRFVLTQGSYKEFIVSGGGSKNATLLKMLVDHLKPLGLRVRMSDEFGIPSQAKEAIAFALLAFETWNRRPSNLPSATGAKRPVILGKVSYVDGQN